MMNEMYRQLGVSQAVYEFGESILGGLTERFREIDAVAEYNQCKVLAAMQKNRRPKPPTVSATTALP